MDDNFFNQAPPYSQDSQASGSPSAPAAEGSFASNGALSPLAPVSKDAGPRVPPSAPWDLEGSGTLPQKPASAPQAQPQPQPQQASQQQSPKAPSPADDDFFQSSPTGASEHSEGAPTGPVAPASKPVSTAAYDALQKQIASRTAAIDTATKKKEAEITKAASEYVKQQQTKREKEVTDAKAKHQKEQQDGAKKIDAYRKSGAVWSAVGMLVDLQKPNPYCKNTERMRSVLSTLNTMEKPAGAPAAPATVAK